MKPQLLAVSLAAVLGRSRCALSLPSGVFHAVFRALQTPLTYAVSPTVYSALQTKRAVVHNELLPCGLSCETHSVKHHAILQVERLLSEIDGIIYLLDYTKLKTTEEAQIFGKLRQLNPRLVKRLSKRLFFVVSMSFLRSDS